MAEEARRPLVLVPGACLGGWAWREVAQALRGAGHDVYAVTLTGLGERAHLADRTVDLDTHVADVVGLLDYEALSDAVLVGHSYAGTVITAAADRRPERLNAVVYLDTAPLPDGTAIVDVQPPELRERGRLAVAEHGEGWLWPVPDREALTSGIFGSASGLSEAHLRLIEGRASPQPYATMTAPVRLRNGAPAGLRRAAIFCAAGGVDSARVVELIRDGDPRAAAFAEQGWELYDLPTGHWAMFSAPEALAALLARIAGG